MDTKHTARGRASLLAKGTPVALGVIAAGAMATGTTGAQANGVDLEATLDVFRIDLTATLDSRPVQIDLDGDERVDFSISVQPSESEEPIAAEDVTFGAPETATIRGEHGGARILAGRLFPQLFQVGDIVGETDSKLLFLKQALLYDDLLDIEGPFSSFGDTGFIGLVLLSEPEDERERDFDLNFGWLEITRGSVIAGRAGLQTAVGLGAPITSAAVPVPPGLLLLATGALGLGAVARRRKQKA